MQDADVRVNVQSVKPDPTPFHNVPDNASSTCRHCKQALDLCECIRGQNELLKRNVTKTAAVAAKLDTKALRDISALATQTAAVVAVLVATISYTSLLSPPSGWTALEKARFPPPCSFVTFLLLRIMPCFAFNPCWTSMCAIQAPSMNCSCSLRKIN